MKKKKKKKMEYEKSRDTVPVIFTTFMSQFQLFDPLPLVPTSVFPLCPSRTVCWQWLNILQLHT
jgi:hypothetical protein